MVGVLSGLLAMAPSQASSQASDDRPAAGDVVPGQILVRYHEGTTPDQANQAEANVHASLKGTIDGIGVRILNVPTDRTAQALKALARNPHVEFAEQDAIAHATATAITPNDPYWSKQWGTTITSTNTAWSTTTGSTSTVIAELDTGVDFNHPDLQGAFTAGYDFVNNDSNPADDYGHGTEVAGVLAARGNNGTGIAGQCWQCKIMPVKVLNSSGSGSYSGIANGLTYAADHGAKVVNMSLGGSSASSTLQQAVNYAWNKGLLLIAAAGNAGTTAYNYPGAYDPVLAVAGSDNRDARYSWSTYGDWVEVAAPGCDQTTTMGGNYAVPCGTSFASPMTAGIAGLLASANPAASNSTLRNALMNTADAVGSYVSHGRVDAAAAMAAVAGSTTTSPSPTTDPAPSPTASQTTFSGNLNKQATSRSYPVTTTGGSFSAAVAFSRASSLSLTVRSADGTVVAQAQGPSVLRTSGSWTAGTYTFTVSGTERASFDLTVDYTG